MTYAHLLDTFGTNQQCLAHLARLRWPDGIRCETCQRTTRHHLIASRKCYSCQDCGTQVYPTAGTIFENSKVPLPDWFYVIFQLSKTKTGIPAKQIQRELGVSYPTALRMKVLLMDPEPGWIYFVEGGGLVKIGRTTNLKRRLARLRTLSPVPIRLIFAVRSTKPLEHERELHDTFSAWRHHGEWFSLSPARLATTSQAIHEEATPRP